MTKLSIIRVSKVEFKCHLDGRYISKFDSLFDQSRGEIETVVSTNCWQSLLGFLRLAFSSTLIVGSRKLMKAYIFFMSPAIKAYIWISWAISLTYFIIRMEWEAGSLFIGIFHLQDLMIDHTFELL